MESPAKRAGAIALIKKLQSAGVPIAAVGMQGHYIMNWPSRQQVGQAIDEFSQLDIKVMITELDVDVLQPSAGAGPNPYIYGLPDSVQQALAVRYADLFNEFLQHRGQITRVTFWGVTDADSWLNYFPISGRVNYPLLFDRQCRPKAAFDAVVSVARR